MTEHDDFDGQLSVLAPGDLEQLKDADEPQV
jgi:hypothetical protein